MMKAMMKCSADKKRDGKRKLKTMWASLELQNLEILN